MVKRILTVTIVLSVVFTLKLAVGDKVDGYSYVANSIDNTHLTSTLINSTYPGDTDRKTVAGSNKEVTRNDAINNTKTIILSIPAPDLIIRDITWSPESPSVGDIVTFTVTIKNQGGDKADYSHVAYYIDDIYLTSVSVSPIDPGDIITKTFNWTAQAGSHTVKAVADSDNEIDESNETNNVNIYNFSILAPDLIIETITWSPANPSKGDSIAFTVTIKNQGSVRANASRVAFYIDGSSRGDQEVLWIDAGNRVDKTFTWIARAGSHNIKAVADSGSVVTESDEANNEKTVSFSTLAPDLIIEAVTWSPENPQKSDNITFTVTIKNQGSGRADYSRVAYYIDDKNMTSASVSPIDAGATDNQTFLWIARVGSHTFKAVTDFDNEVTESDEANNEKTVSFSTLAPDLIIEAITWSPENPQKSDNITFTVTIKNQGSGRADSFRVRFYIDDSSRGYQDVQEISASAVVTETFTWIARAGSHDIKAVADSVSVITESDETNNKKTVIFSTTPPDLVIEAITWTPENPQESDNITFTVAIKNQGSGKSDYFRVSYYIDDIYLNSGYINPISTNTTSSETFTWIAQAGTHAIKAVADFNNEVIESDETNNEKTIAFLASAPDLIIKTITVSPPSPSVGDTVTFTMTIKNQGNARTDFSRVDFYIDGSSRGYQDIPELDPGAAVTKIFTSIAQADSYAIKVIADPNNEVTESDETNNEKMVTFPLPDLIIEAITWIPEIPQKGDNVTFTVNIKNQGLSKTDYSHITYYIDDTYLTSGHINPIGSGASSSQTFTWIAQVGSHDIKAVADFDNEVTESDETNNEKMVTFPLPDLIIEAITWTPKNPQENDNITFTVTIKNWGSGRADYSRVAYYIDDKNMTSASVSPIDAHATDNQTFLWIARVGSHTFKAVADPENVVIESDETNNEKKVTFSASLPLEPIVAPTPSTTPSPKPQEAPEEKSTPERGIWLNLLPVLALVILAGALIMLLRRRRQH